MTIKRTLCATDLARDLARVVGHVMDEANIPETPKGRKLALLTTLTMAASMVQESDRTQMIEFFTASVTNNDKAKQLFAEMLGADMIREEHTHFVVDFEDPSQTS